VVNAIQLISHVCQVPAIVVHLSCTPVLMLTQSVGSSLQSYSELILYSSSSIIPVVLLTISKVLL